MGSYDLVNIEVTHESADEVLDSLSEASAEGITHKQSKRHGSKQANPTPNYAR